MGEYFEYVNHSKKLKFDIGLNAYNNKFSGIGITLGARAFCLLLTKSEHFNKVYRHTLIGSWIGDKVSCIGDETKWDNKYDRYLDITANIIVMLYQIDGSEKLIEASSQSNSFFAQIAYLIFTEQLTNIIPEFENTFGKEWSKKYKIILQEEPYHVIHNLVELNQRH